MPRAALPIVEQAPADAGACCAACAEARPVAAPLAGPAAALARRPISRDVGRRVTMVGLAAALAFILSALVTWGVGWGAVGAVWLPLHLALAGGAGTAVAAVLPFFTAALAVARPAATWVRVMAIGLVASGAAVVSLSVANGETAIGAIGGSMYLVGIVFVAIAAFRPLRAALGRRRRTVERAYAAALLNVIVSVALATTFLAGWTPVVERWASLKPAHAWLNVVGFVSLIIVATLVHLAPTVEGGRIQPRRSATIAVGALSIGAPGIAFGYLLAADLIVRVGGVVVLLGAVATLVHALVSARDHGRWTTDEDWHRLTRWSLRAASGWFAVGIAAAVGRIVWLGADPQAWSMILVAAPLTVGWVVQTLVGAASHLLPAIGPGDQRVHGAQRAILGRAARARLVGLNLGIALHWAGTAFALEALAVIGAGMVVICLLATTGLFIAALTATRWSIPDRSGYAAASNTN